MKKKKPQNEVLDLIMKAHQNPLKIDKYLHEQDLSRHAENLSGRLGSVDPVFYGSMLSDMIHDAEVAKRAVSKTQTARAKKLRPGRKKVDSDAKEVMNKMKSILKRTPRMSKKDVVLELHSWLDKLTGITDAQEVTFKNRIDTLTDKDVTKARRDISKKESG